MRRISIVSAMALSILGLGASPALAHDDEGWVPVSEDYYAPIEAEVCGDTVLIEGGDVREAEMRETVHPDGTVVTEYRGAATLDITRLSDGAMIDELDISGVGSETFTPDEAAGTATIDNVLFGASLLFPFPDPVDRAAHEAAGLPDLAYFTDPEVSASIRIVIDLETGEFVSVEYVDVPEHVTDLCTWFDDDPRDDHHHDDYHHVDYHHDDYQCDDHHADYADHHGH